MGQQLSQLLKALSFDKHFEVELKYIWIKEYSVIKGVEINFDHSGKHDFHFNEFELAVYPKVASPLNFGERISGVNAIVGKNGSGKSSLCESILSAVATFTNGLFGYEVRFGGIVCIDEIIFYQEELMITNLDQFASLGYRILPFKDSPFEAMEGPWKEDAIRSGFIYYSNTLDLRSGFEMTNLVNISTQAVLQDEYKTGTDMPDLEGRLGISEISRFRLGQGYRMMSFYLRHHDFLPFDGPQYFILGSTYSSNNRFLKRSDKDDARQIAQTLDRAESDLFDEIGYQYVGTALYDQKKTLSASQLSDLIHRLYKLNLLRAIVAHGPNVPELGIVRGFIYLERPSDVDIPPIIRKLAAIHQDIVNHSEVEDVVYNPHSMSVRYRNQDDWRFELLARLWIKNDSRGENMHRIRRLMRFESLLFSANNVRIGRISNYSFWPYLSSGEYSFLTLFSRLDHVLGRFHNKNECRDKLVLFLDEPEIGFHPDWNKKLIKYLLEYLNRGPWTFRFQIIMTTHSPYILSDLPSHNVILLDREKGSTTRIVTTQKSETFGANIHDLLADNFFLDGGTIGEFAREKIQSVIDTLNHWRANRNRADFSISAEQRLSVQRLISLVGDSIVRNKLFDMYWEIAGEQNAVDSEIQQLEERISQLKLRRNDNN